MQSSSDPKSEDTKSSSQGSGVTADSVQTKEKSPGTEEGGASGKFLRLPIFAGSSNVELDDTVELPEEPAETVEEEDDGLGDSLWTIQKRKERENVERQETAPSSSKPESRRTSDGAPRDKEAMESSVGKNQTKASKAEEEEKVKSDKTDAQSKIPGKGKDSKSRNYRSKHAFLNTSKSSTELYSDIDDDADLPISSKSSQRDSEKSSQRDSDKLSHRDNDKSKKHSDIKEKSRKRRSSIDKYSADKSSSDKRDRFDLFDDRTQDSFSDKLDSGHEDDFKLEKSPKPGDVRKERRSKVEDVKINYNDAPQVRRTAVDDVKFDYEDSNDSAPSTSWSDAGVGSAIITDKEYSGKYHPFTPEFIFKNLHSQSVQVD
jgi:hypothetical protein